MDHSRLTMDKPLIIGTPDAEVHRFVELWTGQCDYIEAHTSGSTGKPKGVLLPKADMATSARNTIEFFGIDNCSKLALPLSVSYIAGKMMLVRAILSGAEIYVEPASNHPLRNVGNAIFDLVAIVPSQIQGLLEVSDRILIRNLIVGGAPMSDDMERMLLDAGIKAYATYGMTETCSHVALREVGQRQYKALPGITFDTDSRGCLVINAPEYTFRRLVTNDMVSLHGFNSFEWLGRYDNVINSGGIKIQPEQIEYKLQQVMGNMPYYVTSAKSNRWGEEMVLVVESRYEVPQLMERVSEVLDKYERPKNIIYEPIFQRTHNGKLKRKKY